MLAIGNITLRHPIILAPLAGVSDMPFRMVARAFGCELAYVEMLSIHALSHRNRKTMELLDRPPGDKPLGVQILGRDPERIERAMDFLEPCGFDLLDLNAACPVKKVAKRGEGAALMKEPEVLEALLRVMVRKSAIPVTVKIRSGWDGQSVNAAEIARRAEQAGVAAIYIHGRTRTQQYSGQVDYAPIAEAVRAVSVPVIGSGDVFDAIGAKRMLDETGCAGVVAARGAMGNPWIFPETRQYLDTGTIPGRPDIHEITRVMREHLNMCVALYGDEVAVKIYRKFFIWYTKGLHGAKPLRMQAVKCRDAACMAACMDALEAAGLVEEEV
jgi:tRNA-dihydrouridine synthase B